MMTYTQNNKYTALPIIPNETTELHVSMMRIQFEWTKPTAMTVIKP